MPIHPAASRLGAPLVGLATLAACAAGTPGGDAGPPPRPPMAEAECRGLLATASPATLAAQDVALLIAEPRLIENGAARPVGLRLREQTTGETASLDCADGAVAWGAIPPGRWNVEALIPAGGAPGRRSSACVSSSSPRLSVQAASSQRSPPPGPASTAYAPWMRCTGGAADSAR